MEHELSFRKGNVNEHNWMLNLDDSINLFITNKIKIIRLRSWQFWPLITGNRKHNLEH